MKLSIPATFFIPINFIEGSEVDPYLGANFKPMEWKHVKTIADNDLFSIGSHTLTHPRLTKLNKKEIEKEIIKSKTILERKLNRKIDMIAYLGGYFDDEIVRITKKANYKMGLTVKRKVNTPKTDLLRLGRFSSRRGFKI